MTPTKLPRIRAAAFRTRLQWVIPDRSLRDRAVFRVEHARAA